MQAATYGWTCNENFLTFRDYANQLLAIDVNLDTTEMLDVTWGLFSLSHSKNEGTNFGFALTGGAFVADNVAVLLNFKGNYVEQHGQDFIENQKLLSEIGEVAFLEYYNKKVTD